MNRGIGHGWYVIKKLYNLSFQFFTGTPRTPYKKKQGQAKQRVFLLGFVFYGVRGVPVFFLGFIFIG